jgi:hypothetical protein
LAEVDAIMLASLGAIIRAEAIVLMVCVVEDTQKVRGEWLDGMKEKEGEIWGWTKELLVAVFEDRWMECQGRKVFQWE